jgi:hypothetical protein
VETADATSAKNPAFAGDPSAACSRKMAELVSTNGFFAAVPSAVDIPNAM